MIGMLEMILTETVKSTLKDAAKKQTGEIRRNFMANSDGRPRSNTAVKPFVPSGRPKERTCLLASRSGTLAAVTTTRSTLAENINGSVAFSPLGA